MNLNWPDLIFPPINLWSSPKMNILDALNKQKKAKPEQAQITVDSYISNGVFTATLFRMGVDNEIIQDCLRKPVEIRGELLDYFESLENDN